MENNRTDLEVTFKEVVADLIDIDTPLNPKYLFRLSDLAGDELTQINQAWSEIPASRRQALLENLEQMFADDYLLSFETICRFAMKDPEPKVRLVAIRSLQEYQVQDLVPTFLQMLEQETDEKLRALAASSLGKYIYYGELEEVSLKLRGAIEKRLLGIASGTDTNLVRRRAVESLGFSSHERVPDLIKKAFDTKDEEWMTSALLAMGRSCDNRWDQEVLKMLAHTSPKVRCEAARAAGELVIYQTKPTLVELLEDADPDVRLASIWSLSQIGGSGLQQIFERMLDEMEYDKEAQFIVDALDNLLFNQSIGLHDPFEFKDEIDFEDDLDYEDLYNGHSDEA